MINYILFWVISIFIWIFTLKFIVRRYTSNNKFETISNNINFGSKTTLKFDLSSSLYDELVSISKASNHSFGSIIGKGIKLFQLGFEAKINEQRLAIIDSKGNVVKEITDF